MSLVRRHLAWMICGWLVCQVASVAAAPLVFCCRSVPAADPDDKCCRVSYTLSKAMNNVGENFFSSPIDPFDINKDRGRSDDDQRHRLVLNGSVNSSMDPARSGWERLTHGFQVSSLLQTYSSLPFNITSGVTTVQGTAGRPIVDGNFIQRNAGVGSDFFTLSLRVSRAFTLGGSVRAEGLVEVFNVTNRRNDLTRNTNFGSGTYPTSPSATFNQITAVGDPRTMQFALRLRFWEER